MIKFDGGGKFVVSLCATTVGPSFPARINVMILRLQECSIQSVSCSSVIMFCVTGSVQIRLFRFNGVNS